MKVLLILLFWVGISVPGCFSQTGALTIKTIDEQVKNILAGLNECEKTERVSDKTGSHILYTCEAEKVAKIRIIDNNIIKEVMWVYHNDSPIYAEQLWRRESNEVIDHEKFYFDKKDMIAWTKTDGSFVDVNSDEFIEVGRDIITQSRRSMVDND